MQIIDFFKGIIIGIALVIPGLSGSIFAVIVGLYDKIIISINNLKKDFINEFIFLSPILLGTLVGILISTKFVLYACIAYPIFSYSFFIGLVFGSLKFVLSKVEDTKITVSSVALFCLALFFMIFMSSIENSTENSYIVIDKIKNVKDFSVVLYAGAFSTSLMIIPGVSGSILLMIINQYGTIYNAVANTSDFVVSLLKGNEQMANENLQSVLVLIPFVIGAVIGIWFVSKILAIIINHYEKYLYVAVLGIVVAAVITLFKQGIIENMIYFGSGLQMITSLVICIFFVVCGYLVSKFCNWS